MTPLYLIGVLVQRWLEGGREKKMRVGVKKEQAEALNK